MEIIRHTSLGKMIPCRSAQCNHSYCVSCSTAVLVIVVPLIVLLTPTVEAGVRGRRRLGGGGTRVKNKLTLLLMMANEPETAL